MKRAGIVVVILALTTVALSQQPAPPKATQPAAPQPGATPPATPPAGPPEKSQPRPKTQAEADAYKAAMALTDPIAMEKAANDFAVAYPDSDLSPLLFRTVMRTYQSANNSDKLLEMGQKLLQADPNDPEALVNVAQVITERTRDTDLDKDQRREQAMKYAQHALETVDTDIPLGLAPEQEALFKSLMRSNAYSVIGLLQFNEGKFDQAAGSFRKSIDAFPQQPDPVTILRLAFALDKQGKYPEALTEAKHSVELTQDGTTAGTLARREQDRLVKLTSAAAPAK